MTLLTILAEPSLVHVLFAVARHTRRGQLFELWISLVAALARCRQMLAEQGELGVPIVIERNIFPRLGRVTRFARHAIFALVLILLAMTIITQNRHALPTLTDMA